MRSINYVNLSNSEKSKIIEQLRKKIYGIGELLQEQDDKNGIVSVDSDKNIAGYKTILTPNDKFTYIAEKSTVSLIDNNDIMRYKVFKNWASKERGGNGDSYTDQWVPNDTSKFIKIGSVGTFRTPDNKVYKAVFTNNTLENSNMNTWDDFRTWTNNNGGKPNDWEFKGYVDESGKPYVAPKQPEKPWY